MKFKEFIRELNGENAEGELIKTSFISLCTSLVLLGILYFFFLRGMDNLIPKYGFYLLFASISYAMIIPSIRHIRAYANFPCMSGMMIGMTIGMISGFLPGFFVGATNGMFYGSIFGIAVGTTFGAWNGKCCGIMGIMEGIMAGFMGGLMGAMTSIMMLNDHIKIAGIIVFVISSVILFGLNFMIYTETRESERKRKEDHFSTFALSFILTGLTLLIMLFGPRSVLFQ